MRPYGILFCRFPSSCRLVPTARPSGQFAPSVIHKKHNGNPRQGRSGEAVRSTLDGVSCCAMKSPPTGNAPEGLSCPQRGRRRKPGEKLRGLSGKGEAEGNSQGWERAGTASTTTPPLGVQVHTPYPDKKTPSAENEKHRAMRVCGFFTGMAQGYGTTKARPAIDKAGGFSLYWL